MVRDVLLIGLEGPMSLSRLLPPTLVPGFTPTGTSSMVAADGTLGVTAGEGARRLSEAGLGWLSTSPAGGSVAMPGGIVNLLDEISGVLPPPLLAALGCPLERLLAERAAIARFGPGARISVGGRCRLLRTADGWVAVSLVRDDDVASMPAWLGVAPFDGPEDPWPAIEQALRRRATYDVVAVGAELGLAVGGLGEIAATSPAVRASLSPGRVGVGDGLPHLARQDDGLLAGRRVVDLSSLWAGPLCAHLLGLAGAEVVKVESLHRPDGARRGPRAFYDLLHAGHASVAVDFRTLDGSAALRDLIASADVVIEASRPRALRQLGIDAASTLRSPATGPRVWVSITGYGREHDVEHRVAFGDDAAVAGGLVGWAGEEPVFLGDAIADPLTGIAAAAGVIQALRIGGRWILDVALARVAAAFNHGQMHTLVGSGPRPQARIASGRAAAIGADNARLLT